MKPRSIYLLTCLFLVFTTLQGQSPKDNKNRILFGTYHERFTNTHGISFGIGSSNSDTPLFANTNGVKVALFGAGILVPLFPQNPIPKNEYEYTHRTNRNISERINGISLSTFGSVCHCVTTGISVGLVGHLNYKINGLSTAVVMNYALKHNGLQMAFITGNYYMHGIQLGGFNKAQQAKGLQVGFWNNGNKMTGIQLGAFNSSQINKGVQIALFNSNTNTIKGLQVAAFNDAKSVAGVQIGLINSTQNLTGIQIGLWNINSKRSLPFINWNF